MKLSIVIPLKRNTHSSNDEVDRFCQIGLPSLLKFMDLSEVDRLVLITPENEAPDIEARVRVALSRSPTPTLRLKFLHDNHLSPIPTSGWLFQQLLKLEVANFITAPYYLVLDSDIYLTKPLVPSRDLLDTQGRLLMTTDPISYHPDWYTRSCQVLQTPFDQLYPSPNTRVMQVTPQVLITAEVRALLAHLIALYQTREAYQTHLLQNGFTEFSLYWSWLVSNNKHTALYQTESGGNLGKESPDSPLDKESDAPRLMGNALWFAPPPPHTLASWVERQFKNNQNYYFSLIQSNIPGLSLDTIAALFSE